jgi:Flp pilus assembly pilin Flp
MRIATLLHRTRARFARLRRDEAGASVLEWAMIAAVVVVAATLIGATI